MQESMPDDYSKNIQALFQIFGSNQNGGCFGALVSEMSFRREIERKIFIGPFCGFSGQ